MGVTINMSMTPEQLARRRVLIKEKRAKVQQIQPHTNNVVATKNLWERRGIRCDRYDGLTDKLKRMLSVETSFIVPDIVSDARTDKCRGCRHVSEKTDGTLFCECCGCPSWTFTIANKLIKKIGLGEAALGSDLQSKNRHAQHECLAEDPRFGVYKKGSNNGSS